MDDSGSDARVRGGVSTAPTAAVSRDEWVEWAEAARRRRILHLRDQVERGEYLVEHEGLAARLLQAFAAMRH